MNNNYPKIYLRKKEERRIFFGHQWIFSNEISNINNEFENGEIVSVYNNEGKFFCCGFYNKNSLITVRKISFEENFNLNLFLKERIIQAKNLRENFYPERNSYRLIFSESDFLPGLIIDKYNDTYVLQINSAGIEKNIKIINEILINELNAKTIFTKNEPYFRKLENLPDTDEVYFGDIKNELIVVNGIKYEIDFENSHKTGFYFDQVDNRLFIEKITKGKTALDSFCNSGGFGLHAIKSGASSVDFVDSSIPELEKVNKNIMLNKFNTKTELINKDVFEYLIYCSENNIKYDIVIVDPPAFAKNKKSIPQALKGYQKLNKLALSIVNKNGFLVTSSCSYHIKKEEFISEIVNASGKSGKEIQLIHYNEASFDHPSLPSMPETSYLKFAVFKVS